MFWSGLNSGFSCCQSHQSHQSHPETGDWRGHREPKTKSKTRIIILTGGYRIGPASNTLVGWNALISSSFSPRGKAVSPVSPVSFGDWNGECQIGTHMDARNCHGFFYNGDTSLLTGSVLDFGRESAQEICRHLSWQHSNSFSRTIPVSLRLVWERPPRRQEPPNTRSTVSFKPPFHYFFSERPKDRQRSENWSSLTSLTSLLTSRARLKQERVDGS